MVDAFKANTCNWHQARENGLVLDLVLLLVD